MCGIAGIFEAWEARAIDRTVLAAMNRAQAHRGPDDEGVHIEPGLGLAHRRLSIIDLDSGHQPLFNEDGSVAVVYNGEIYNFRELMGELEATGHVFRTACDTEVIAHAWEEWGEDCVDRFRGMFAFAVWDRSRETLFLARDRLGIKPLHYAVLPGGRLLFASELKGLLQDAQVPRELEPRAVEDYFAFGYVPDPRTIFQNLFKLPPGHTLTFCRRWREPRVRQYWDVGLEPRSLGSEKEVGAELIERLRDAVEVRLMSDVPLGAFLSGGVDSSAVVATMAGISDEAVRTCSISFSDPAFDEADYATAVAQRYGTDHQQMTVDPEDIGLVDRLAGIYDEPYADSSAIPTYRVCELARQRVKVALSGDGGDELFGGYRRYRWHLREESVRRLLPTALRRPVFGLAGAVYPKLDWAPRGLRAKTTLQSLARDPLEAYMQSVGVVGEAMRRQLFSPQLRRDLQGYRAVDTLRQHAESGPDQPLLQAQYLDMKTYLPGDILTKVDRASMAHGLEVRVPVLDHRFVEWGAGLHPGLKYRRGEGKYVFKKALEGHIPMDVLYRRKMGFAVPLASWFRGALAPRVRQLATSQSLSDSGLFNMDVVKKLVTQHQSGLRDHSAPLWSLLMFEAFCQRQLGTPGSHRAMSASAIA